ncbi:hypothetical protein D3C78_1768150 [compost metagenome]
MPPPEAWAIGMGSSPPARKEAFLPLWITRVGRASTRTSRSCESIFRLAASVSVRTGRPKRKGLLGMASAKPSWSFQRTPTLPVSRLVTSSTSMRTAITSSRRAESTSSL